MNAISVPVDRTSPSYAKIGLFRSLFRGREDIYPRRFESRKTGKSGYAPACANEWVRGICEKPRIKCAECPNRRFLPVTDDVIRWHLSGHDPDGQPFVAGVYPLLRDETCFFLAVDFDKTGWQEDAAAFLETCRRLNVPTALERSRSGRGAHVWFFFAEAIPAGLARRLGSHVITETMEGRPDIGLDSSCVDSASRRDVLDGTNGAPMCRHNPLSDVESKTQILAWRHWFITLDTVQRIEYLV